MTSVSEENLPSPSRKTALFLFLFGFAVAFVFVFVLYGRQNAVAVAYDVNGFGGLGRRLASGEGFSLGSGLTMRRAPLYPGLVALLLTIFGVSGEGAEIYRPVFFVQCLMVGATGVVVWAIGRELFNERTGRIAGVLTPLLPQTLRYVSSTEVETLMGLLIALMAWTGLRFWRHPGMAQAVLFALVCAASTLTKPMGLPYPFVFCICLFLKFRRTEGSKLFVATGACLGVYLLCLFPWSLRNSIVSEGKFRGISTNAAGEFLRGYVLAQPKFFLLKQDFGGNDSRELIWDVEANDYEQKAMESYSVPFYKPGEEADRRPMPINAAYEVAKDRVEGQIARKRISENPAEFIKKFAAQTCTFWFIVETKKKSVVIGGMALLMLFLAGVGIYKAKQNGRDTFPALLVLLYFHLLYAVILAFARYSFPLYPTLLIFVGYAIDNALTNRHNSRNLHANRSLTENSLSG